MHVSHNPNSRGLKAGLAIGIPLISISSVTGYIEIHAGFTVGNTTFWWIIHALLLLLFFSAKKKFYTNEVNNLLFVKLYLLWNIICIIRGTFVAENYWDWKGLTGNSMVLLLPLITYPLTNPYFIQLVFKCYIRYALFIFLAVSFLIVSRAYGFYLAPISILIFFMPAMKTKWKILIMFFTILVLFVDLGARSNVIKFSVPLLLLFIFLFQNVITTRLLLFTSKLFFVAPIIFFLLSTVGKFNVFKVEDYTGINYEVVNKDAAGNISSDVITGDTRSFLYAEVLETAEKYNTWLFGRSPARGNETEAFFDFDVTERGERLSNEVAVLNIFTWTGIIGVILYFLIFYRASFLAINYSNNTYSKMLGIFLAFRWMYAWVEDINVFTLSYMFLWVLIGMCFSNQFRNMTNYEIKVWVQGIFENKKNVSKYSVEPKID